MPISFYFKKHNTKEVERYWKQQWKIKMVFSHGINHSKGVAILFNEKLDFEIKHSIVDQNGRFIILDIEIQGNPVILTNVYFPCASKPRKQEFMWDNLRKFISEIDNCQGFQLSRIERESPAWTLFLPVSRQACKISRISEINPAKHVKSPASVGKNLENNYLANFHTQGGTQPKKSSWS